MKWISIAITAPEACASGPEKEAGKIAELLRSDAVEFVHIRKPGVPEQYLRDLIESVPADLHCRLTLHDHLNLAGPLGVGGVHLNSRYNAEPPQWNGRLSRSCHSLEEACEWAAKPAINYVTLSPVFDSISKAEHHAAFTLAGLRGKLPKGKVIALAGVAPDKFALLRRTGFAGAAMLGYIWQGAGDFEERLKALRLRRMLIENFPLLLVTDSDIPDEAVSQACAAYRGGCRWFQLRMKNADTAVRAETLRRLRRELGDDALIMVDDDTEAARLAGADGVHLGVGDMPTAAARRILGPAPLIGRTAHNLQEALIPDAREADYLGVGPYRFTRTKEKLASLLGAEGLTALLAGAREAGMNLPVTAIGGIEPSDVKAVLDAGADGVAVSGAINRADDPVQATRAFLMQL